MPITKEKIKNPNNLADFHRKSPPVCALLLVVCCNLIVVRSAERTSCMSNQEQITVTPESITCSVSIAVESPIIFEHETNSQKTGTICSDQEGQDCQAPLILSSTAHLLGVALLIIDKPMLRNR